MSSYSPLMNTASGPPLVMENPHSYITGGGNATGAVYSTMGNVMVYVPTDRWVDTTIDTSATLAAISTGTMFGSNGTNTTMSQAECDQKFDEVKMEYMLVFDKASLARVLVTWVVFLVSAVGNCFVLTSVTVRRRRKSISHSQLMMMHLTIANLAFTLCILPVDAIWKTTLEWYGGDFLCRITNVFKQFAMYISSAMIVVMGIDRVANLMCPMSLAGQRRRIRTMLVVAWIFCFLNAVPAGVIFSLLRKNPIQQCPEHILMQCVDLYVVNLTNLRVYYVYTTFVSFFGPLICILLCYLLIAVEISKMAKASKEAQKRCLKRGSSKSVTRRGLDRARRVSLIVTGLISITFIICWGPYYVTGLIEWFEKQESVSSQPAPRLSRTARDIMLMSMYLNPMLQPLITVFLMKEIRGNILDQFQRSSGTGINLPKRKPAGIVKMEKNGTKELLPKDGVGNSNQRGQWL